LQIPDPDMKPVKLFALDSLIALLHRWRRWVCAALLLFLGALVVKALFTVVAQISHGQVVEAVRATPGSALLLSVAVTTLAYFALTFYDRTALAYVGVRLPHAVVGKTAFIAYALSNTIGLGMLTGGAVRLRLYGAAGLESGLISRVILFNAAGFTVGTTVVGAAAMVWGAATAHGLLGVPAVLLQAVGVSVLVATGGFMVVCWRSTKRQACPAAVLPSLRVAAQQLLVSTVDVVAAAAALWVLLPSGSVDFAPFVGFFALAIALGAISNVPAGLGVFEAVMLLALGQRMPAEELAGALVLFRLIYNLVPLALGVFWLAATEWRRGVSQLVPTAAKKDFPLAEPVAKRQAEHI
jgi:phosphatidylglycerol lysyltransferase